MTLFRNRTDKHPHTLAQRRAMLITECALQRITLSSQYRSISQVTGWIGVGRNLFGILTKKQDWKNIILTGLMTFLPGRSFSLIKKGLLVWQVWRAMYPKDKK